MSKVNVFDFHHMNEQQIYCLIHEMVDQFCGICPLNSSKYVPNVWTQQEFNQLTHCLKNLFWDLIDIRGKPESLQRFPEDIHKVLMEAIEVRRPELRKAIVNNTIADDNPVLKDFFWRLNHVLDSDRMNGINEPLLNLDLNISDQNKDTIVSMELNREELEQVIKTLEEAQQELRQSF